MKKIIIYSLLSASLLSSFSSVSAQDTLHRPAARQHANRYQAPQAPVDQTLQGQYQDMLMRSRTQEGYKLVNPFRLTNLWKNTMDSLRAEKKARREAQAKLSNSAGSIQAMTDSLQKNQQELEKSMTEINSIFILGMPVAKSLYNTIMWGLVIILGIALAAITMLMGKHKNEANYRIKLFEELTAEFQSYKAKANEREKKLARELQDERNKLDDMNNGIR